MPAGPLGFFHSGGMHVPVFEAMVHSWAPGIPMRHRVREDLLEEAQRGGLTPAVREQVAAEILDLAAEGAVVVLCTCSTLGPGAETAASRTDVPVLRIDRPMIERALDTGRRVLVAAALESTLGPTRDLLKRVASERGIRPEITDLVVPGAWALFEAGAREAYWQRIADAIRPRAGEVDVVLLAQASMAGAAELLADLALPVLSSPELGVRAAIEAWRRQTQD